MANGIGIDISGYQPTDVSGDWDFIVVKSTEGTRVTNPRVDAQWRNAARAPRRGLYHYARPGLSSGAKQAFAFSDDALARGFRPGVDMWQLDCEGQLNDGVGGAAWRAFVDQFMLIATSRLGKAGTIYSGMYFYRADIVPERFNWWVPAYGPNDGAVHPLPAKLQNVVLIHQFTSVGALDRNRVVDQVRFDAMFTPTTPPPPPKPKVAPRFNPPLHDVVDALEISGYGSWVLQRDGGVFTDEGHFYGSMVGNPHWGDRAASQLVVPGTIVEGANAPVANEDAYVMVVVAESGERYGLGQKVAAK